MTAKPDDKELVEVAGTFHNDTFDENGNPEPRLPWGELWNGWLEAKRKPTKTTEQMIQEAKAFGVEVTVTQRPKGTGEIVPLPGVRPPPERDA